MPDMPEIKPDTERKVASKAARLLGGDTPNLENKEVVHPEYLVVYLHHGTLSRAGVGHVSIWDGSNFYSYGGGDDRTPWIKPAISSNNADSLADEQSLLYYGPYSRIVLPVNKYLHENIYAVQTTINEQWQQKQYSVRTKNCAHLVATYFDLSQYAPKIYDWVIPLYPKELASRTREIGKAMVHQILIDSKQLTKSNEKCVEYAQYMDNLKAALYKNKEIGIENLKQELAVLFENKENKDNKDVYYNHDLFYKILGKIAEKHYSNTEPKDFCDLWLMNALRVCPIFPNFTYPPAKTRYVRAITRAFIGVLGAIASTPLVVASAAVGVATAIAGSVVGLVMAIAAIPVVLVMFPFLPTSKNNNASVEPAEKLGFLTRFKNWVKKNKKIILCVTAGILLVAAGIFTGGAIYAAIAGVGLLGIVVTALTTVGLGYLGVGAGLAGILGAWIGFDFYKFSMFKPKSKDEKNISVHPPETKKNNSGLSGTAKMQRKFAKSNLEQNVNSKSHTNRPKDMTLCEDDNERKDAVPPSTSFRTMPGKDIEDTQKESTLFPGHQDDKELGNEIPSSIKISPEKEDAHKEPDLTMAPADDIFVDSMPRLCVRNV